MLRIQDIRKKYVTGDLTQTALDGVSLNLRENEFVAILGPSGSGKTTLLNVIGGLDRYDSGDLIIDGVSTKQYTDRDWDSYRNHTVGFVFQSYNLIPHQTVLANVELALTISGISRSERRRRATIALQEVGLGNQLHKKPNQMSGGQMQRVAIARALVNNPSVLLADEPTGALDSETSVQVMELLKKVSQDRLVVMVTHNPELAYEYASRIVRVKDGQITDDTNPLTVDEQAIEPPVHRNLGKASMNFGAALALSFNNLRTKKARTLLTAFAGSIGIIGIALILSLSSGFQNYIDEIQKDTLANYPLTLQSETADMSAGFAMMGMGGGSQKTEVEPGTVAEMPMLSKMFANIGNNDLGAFKEHLESHMDEIGHTLNAVQYGYGINPRIFKDDPDEILQVNPETLFTKLTGSAAMSAMMQMNSFQEMIDNPPLLDAQYQLLQGRWPESYNELVFILPDESRVPDFAAYILGMKPLDGVDQMMEDIMNGKEVDFTANQMTWTYDDLMAQQFRLVSSADLYQYNPDYDVWEDMSGDEAYMRSLIDSGELLKVVGVICPKEDAAASMMPGIGYLPSLTQHVMENAREAPIVKAQLETPGKDVFSGQSFSSQEDEERRELNFEDMIQVDADAISSAFGMNISQDEIMALMEDYLGDALRSIKIDPTEAQAAYLTTLSELANEMLGGYVTQNADASGAATLYLTKTEAMIDAFLAGEFAQEKISALADDYGISVQPIGQATKPLLLGLVTGYIGQSLAGDLVPESPVEPVPDVTLPSLPDDATLPSLPEDATLPSLPEDATLPTLPPDVTLPENPTVPEMPLDPDTIGASLTAEQIGPMVEEFIRHPVTAGAANLLAGQMMQPEVGRQLSGKIAAFGRVLGNYLGSSFYVDEEKIAGAFQFNLNEAELRRLMEAMSGQAQERTAKSNLRQLGYADPSDPTSMDIYMTDFTGKEEFMQFLDDYNADMIDSGHEEQEIHYMDMTGMMMSSVKTIIDSISYVLIAFVAVSLVVSSIMIGIITYISVMERTKEIGVLRAMGASKHNISQVFNAETYLIGLCSGLIGVGITLLALIPINRLMFRLTGNPDITAMLPVTGAVVLILLSVFLTVLGGLIPSRQAARKDPVIALRSE